MNNLNEEKDDLRNQLLRQKNQIKALEKQKNQEQEKVPGIDLDHLIYCFQVKMKNMLGNFSVYNLLVRKKLSRVHYISLEEKNGDEFDIEMKKLVRIQKVEETGCIIAYKTVFQRKVTVEFASKQLRSEFFQIAEYTLRNMGIDNEQVQSIICS